VHGAWPPGPDRRWVAGLHEPARTGCSAAAKAARPSLERELCVQADPVYGRLLDLETLDSKDGWGVFLEFGIPCSELSLSMMPLEPPPNLTDQVYRRVLEAIIDGSLPPASRIRQDELARKLGVSRQPVSHALLLLRREGLLAESGRRGFEVTELDPARLRQLYEVRSAVDALAAALAAKRVGSDHVGRKQLEAALHAGREIDPDTDRLQLIALDVEFHDAIYRLSGNPVIQEMMAPQWPHIRRSMAAVLAEADHRHSAWQVHAAIAQHILAGDPAAAERAAREHALTAGQRTEARLRALVEAA